MYSFLKPTLLSLSFLSIGLSVSTAAHPSRGLWVGEVALDQVNEATGAVGDSNTYEFTDPEVTTPTSDTAYLRLILHVNGAGQVQLLKSVAIVNDGDDNIVLLTDPDLYSNYPGIAQRIASAFFDYSNTAAVTAVDALIDTATETAVTEALGGAVRSAIEAAIVADLDDVILQADGDTAYFVLDPATASYFRDDFFTPTDSNSIADKVAELIDGSIAAPTAVDFLYADRSVRYAPPFATDPLGGNFNAKVILAELFRDQTTLYGDTRGIDAIVNLVVAAADAVTPTDDLADRQADARLAAQEAWFNAADVGQAYNRFLARVEFTSLPEVMVPVAAAEALAAEALGEDEAGIIAAVTAALLGEAPVQLAYTEASLIAALSKKGTFDATPIGDLRPKRRIDLVVAATAESAAAQVLLSTDEDVLLATVEDAIDTTLDGIDSDPVFATAPLVEYSEFVTGTDYSAAATKAAQTAASEAFFQYSSGETDPERLTKLTRSAVNKALVATRNTAATLPQHSILLDGTLEASGSVSGELKLAALAPTNPFLHRFHPDNSEGFAIHRKISITVDSPEGGASFERAGYGVSRLSGTYLEEISGLHKPLGNSQDIGLKTQGSFTLNRLTLIDTLNF
ncbi:MAG: hypothetical protein ACSHX4_02070 [Opitutaceae bacterium]